MPVEPQYMCRVLYDGTNLISMVFGKWSRSKGIGQYQCNFDHRRQTLSYFGYNINRCSQKYDELVTTLQLYDTIIDLHVCKMTVMQGHRTCQSSKRTSGGDAPQPSAWKSTDNRHG